jgi:hypothetical protein
MKLDFSPLFTKGALKGEETYFPEKILKEYFTNNTVQAPDYLKLAATWYEELFEDSNYNFRFNPDFCHKKHTIRADRTNRWKVASKIDFTINIGTENEFKFAEGECKSIQKIKILPKNSSCDIFIDDEKLSTKQVVELVQNDGFDSLDDFMAYFDTDFEGKLIHWMNFNY